MSPIENVIQVLGTQEALAGILGISPQAVSQWKGKIPINRVLDIERSTNARLTRYMLRPDVFGEYSEANEQLVQCNNVLAVV